MTPKETVILVAYVNAACPQQAMSEYTPEAWHDILGHLELAECREAARAIASRQPFVAPSEIIREIADKRSVAKAHSNACRAGDCRDCRVSWCNCICHPAAVAALTSPQPAPRPAIEPRSQASVRRREDNARQLGPADLAAIRRPGT